MFISCCCHLLNAHCVSDTVLNALHGILTRTLCNDLKYEGTEAPKSSARPGSPRRAFQPSQPARRASSLTHLHYWFPSNSADGGLLDE